MHERGDDAARAPARRVTPAQVVGIGLIVVSLGWAAWLLRDRPISEEVELLPGTVLPSSEMAIIEAAFDRGQLTDHRTEAGRVWVPRQRQSAYMRALVDAEALPREFGSSLRRALEQNSPWQSRAVQEEMLRVAVQEELAHVICSMPGIERAAVLYDVDERSSVGSLAAAPTRTASVNIRTQPDVELEPARVQAIRVLVAASIAGLDAERVAVTDLRSGRGYAGPLVADPNATDVSVTDPDLARRIAHERHLATKLRQALSFIRGVVVDVTVTFTPPPAEKPRLSPPSPPPNPQRVAGANEPAEVGRSVSQPLLSPPLSDLPEAGPDAPTAILVSLAVPEGCFAAPTPSGSEPASPTMSEDQLRGHVLSLLPPTRQPSGRRVVVTRYSEQVESRPHLSRKAGAESPVAEDRLRSGPPLSLEEAWKAVLSGRAEAVPREVWLGVIAIATAVLGWLVLRPQSGSPAPPRYRHRAQHPVDWATVETGDLAADPLPPKPQRQAA